VGEKYMPMLIQGIEIIFECLLTISNLQSCDTWQPMTFAVKRQQWVLDSGKKKQSFQRHSQWGEFIWQIDHFECELLL